MGNWEFYYIKGRRFIKTYIHFLKFIVEGKIAIYKYFELKLKIINQLL
jgi:hypothetical protein